VSTNSLNSCGVRSGELLFDSFLADWQVTVMCLVRIWDGARCPEVFLYAFGCLENNADGRVLKGHLTLCTVLSSTCNKNTKLDNVNDVSVRVHIQGNS